MGPEPQVEKSHHAWGFGMIVIDKDDNHGEDKAVNIIEL
mgnify:CR=1 FL=1